MQQSFGPGISLPEIGDLLPDSVVRDRLATYGTKPDLSITEAAGLYGVSGYAAESIPFALFSASKLPAYGFERLLDHIISVGGDTDTNASIAGQLCGTVLGFNALPRHLVARLPQQKMVTDIAESFAETIVGR